MNPLRTVAHGARLTPTLLRQAVVKAWHDRVLGLSAEAAFWQMLSLPSLFLALVGLLGYVSGWFGQRTVHRTELQIESTLARAFSPQVVDEVIRPTLREVLHGGRAGIVSIGFVLALWAGSSATATFVNTVTIAYDMRDLRGPIRSRLLALGLFLGTVLLGVVLLPMLVLGPDLLRRTFPDSVRSTVSKLVDIGYYPVLIVMLMIGLTTFYKLAPPRRLPWGRGLPGATLALLVFLAGSAGLREYITFVLDHNHAYAAVAAPIAALLFFFVLALGVLLGAEFNAAVEQYRPARVRSPRLLQARGWRRYDPEGDGEPEPPGRAARIAAGTAAGGAAFAARTLRRAQSRRLS